MPLKIGISKFKIVFIGSSSDIINMCVSFYLENISWVSLLEPVMYEPCIYVSDGIVLYEVVETCVVTVVLLTGGRRKRSSCGWEKGREIDICRSEKSFKFKL
jgi:hypothetical protein